MYAHDESRPRNVLGCASLMAHLWLPDSHDTDATPLAAGWMLQPLDDAFELGASARVLRAATPEGPRWVLLAGPSVRVNGDPAVAGIVALRDRDEICTDGRHLVFSTETLAVVVPFVGGDRETLCPRCRLEIVDATPSVACPQCGTWYHQDVARELLCWTYSERCARCDQPTALDAGYRWTPEGL